MAADLLSPALERPNAPQPHLGSCHALLVCTQHHEISKFGNNVPVNASLFDLRLFLDPDAILAVARWGALIMKWILGGLETGEVAGASRACPLDSWEPSAPYTRLTCIVCACG